MADRHEITRPTPNNPDAEWDAEDVTGPAAPPEYREPCLPGADFPYLPDEEAEDADEAPSFPPSDSIFISAFAARAAGLLDEIPPAADRGFNALPIDKIDDLEVLEFRTLEGGADRPTWLVSASAPLGYVTLSADEIYDAIEEYDLPF